MAALAVCAALLASSASAALRNLTMDDIPYPSERASVVYSPTTAWSSGRDCVGCHAQPDPDRLHARTWHDTTDDGELDTVDTNITITFVGSAIYVYGVLCNNASASTGTMANYDFALDGVRDGNFHHDPDITADTYIYDVLFYSASDLEDKAHELVVNVAGGSGAAQSSLMLFDYCDISYDLDAESATAPSSTTLYKSVGASPTGTAPSAPSSEGASPPSHRDSPIDVAAVAGAVAGGVVGLAALATATCLLRRRRRRLREKTSDGSSPAVRPYLEPDHSGTAGSRARLPSAELPLARTPRMFSTERKPVIRGPPFSPPCGPATPSTSSGVIPFSSPNRSVPSLSPSSVAPTSSRTDLDKRVRDMEERIAVLRTESDRMSGQMTSATGQCTAGGQFTSGGQLTSGGHSTQTGGRSTVGGPSNTAFPPSMSSDPFSDGASLRRQIEGMQAEIAALHEQQRDMLDDLAEPPPAYSHLSG
ncbi:hypothetical protein HDZ31DRAFT_66575 [Schizophyllum fasciatum]